MSKINTIKLLTSKTHLYQTTVVFETEQLSEIENPIFLSIIARPGFSISCLNSFGFAGEYQLFNGKQTKANNTTFIKWGCREENIESKRNRIIKLC